MTMQPWVSPTDPHEIRRLGKTVEELGELVAVLGRTLCQGLGGVDPASGETNIHRIEKETADVQAQIGCNVMSFALDQDWMASRTAEKMRQMGEWEARFGDLALNENPLKPEVR